MDIKDYIIKQAHLNEVSGFSSELLTVPPTSDMGDFCLPCFSFAKEMKKAPAVIAEELKQKVDTSDMIERAEVVGGYLNFFIKREEFIKNVLLEFLDTKQEFGRNEIGKGKKVFLDFSSPNLAKYMHIGHLANTVIGESIKRILKFCGFDVVAINYLGDYGTPFGKMVAAYKLWGKKEDIEARGVDAIQDLYIKISAEIEKDPSLADLSRDWFRKIEEEDPEAMEIYNWFIDIAKGEVRRIYDILGVTFDDWSGEAKYSKLMQPVLKELEDKKLVVVSEGAKIVDLQDYGLGVCMVQKSDGTSLYATRDLAAVEDRYKTYKFNKGIYLTDVSQKLHFAQWFKVCQLMKKPYAEQGSLVHISYGRFSLPEGKIASRKGKQAIVKDIIDEAISRARKIIEERGDGEIDIDQVSRQVGIGAVVFFPLKHEKTRDVVFDLESALSFDGETSPYMQYTYARCCSVIKKAEEVLGRPFMKDISIQSADLNDDAAFELIKLINQFPDAVKNAANNYEPSIISKLLISISSAYNTYYNTNRIIEEGKVNIGRLMVTICTKTVLQTGLDLLNIASIQKM